MKVLLGIFGLFLTVYPVYAQESGASESKALQEEQEKAKAPAKSWLDQRRKPGGIFGLGVYRPEHIGKYQNFETLYGNTRYQPEFYAGYYLLSYFADIGLMFRGAYYTASGHPISSRKNLEIPNTKSLDNVSLDKNQELKLVLIPLQLVGELAISPLPVRWLVLRGFWGYEWLYVQESIEPRIGSAKSVDRESTSYAVAGYNEGMVLGATLSLSLTGIEPRSDYALQALGLDRMYINLSQSNVSTVKDKMGNFDRKGLSISFSFEALR